jgi:hypothetical protein
MPTEQPLADLIQELWCRARLALAGRQTVELATIEEADRLMGGDCRADLLHPLPGPLRHDRGRRRLP